MLRRGAGRLGIVRDGRPLREGERGRAGASSRRRFAAEPIIKPNAAHPKAVAETPVDDPDWQAIYARREGVERLFSRLKLHRRFDAITVRGLKRVSLMSYLSLIVTNASALAHPEALRQMV